MIKIVKRIFILVIGLADILNKIEKDILINVKMFKEIKSFKHSSYIMIFIIGSV